MVRIHHRQRKSYAPVLFSALGILLMLSAEAHAAPSDDNAVVRDRYGQPVRSRAFGTCVRTGWEAGADACAPYHVVQAPTISAIRQLTQEDRTVYFEFDKAVLTPEGKERLNSLAEALKASPDVRYADIVGFADRIGDSRYNMNLSQRRAKAVRDYLTERGYLNTRLTDVRWLGESRPTTRCAQGLPWNRLVSCLQPDRRVEAEIQFVQQALVEGTAPVVVRGPAQ